MNIGSLGDVVFKVSSETIKTISGLSSTISANISTHSRHGGIGLTEYTGEAPAQISFKILLSKDLGASPDETEQILQGYVSKGAALYLMLGKSKIGRYKWLIKQVKSTAKHYSGTGDVTNADVSISLIEYLKE